MFSNFEDDELDSDTAEAYVVYLFHLPSVLTYFVVNSTTAAVGKKKTSRAIDNDDIEYVASSEEEKPAKRRGRPPKAKGEGAAKYVPIAVVFLAYLTLNRASAKVQEPAARRPRGRPRKVPVK